LGKRGHATKSGDKLFWGRREICAAERSVAETLEGGSRKKASTTAKKKGDARGDELSGRRIHDFCQRGDIKERNKKVRAKEIIL